MLGAFCRIVVPALVAVLAAGVGWIYTTKEIPIGWMFATIIPLHQGKYPATLVGHGKMEGTAPVPDDMTPAPRLEMEQFLELPGEGNRMPQIGLGMCCRATAYDDVLVYRSVLWFLLLGGRHIDTAHLYLNHVPIGKAIAEAIRRGIPRSEIFVTTKIFPTHYGYERAKETLPTYLKELNLDYIDLVLMHFPTPFPPVLVSNDCQKRGVNSTVCRQETWKALSEFQQSQVIRNVGVSNFAVSHLQDIQRLHQMEGTYVAPIAANQLQYSPFTLAPETLDYCHDHNIRIMAYSPLGGMVDREKATTYEVLEKLAAKYQRSVIQVMLRWALQRGAAVIPGTGNPSHMKENLDVYNFVLSEEDMNVINNLHDSDHAKKFLTIDISQLD